VVVDVLTSVAEGLAEKLELIDIDSVGVGEVEPDTVDDGVSLAVGITVVEGSLGLMLRKP